MAGKKIKQDNVQACHSRRAVRALWARRAAGKGVRFSEAKTTEESPRLQSWRFFAAVKTSAAQNDTP